MFVLCRDVPTKAKPVVKKPVAAKKAPNPVEDAQEKLRMVGEGSLANFLYPSSCEYKPERPVQVFAHAHYSEGHLAQRYCPETCGKTRLTNRHMQVARKKRMIHTSMIRCMEATERNIYLRLMTRKGTQAVRARTLNLFGR